MRPSVRVYNSDEWIRCINVIYKQIRTEYEVHTGSESQQSHLHTTWSSISSSVGWWWLLNGTDPPSVWRCSCFFGSGECVVQMCAGNRLCDASSADLVPLQRYKHGFSRLKDGESSATWPGDVANTMSAPCGLTAGWLSTGWCSEISVGRKISKCVACTYVVFL